MKTLLSVLLCIVCVIPAAAQPTPAYTVEKYRAANYPVALAFAPDGRLFYTEKVTGSLRLVQPDGTLQAEPVVTLPTDALVERGMLGVALDPNYAENGHIWVIHTRPGSARAYPANEVVRLREKDGRITNMEVMLSAPITTGMMHHNGGNLHFDADGLLYVTFGDFGEAAHAQDMAALPGKIHRFAVTDDGLIPAPGNPFPDSSVYAYGLRNSFDFTFDPVSGGLFATENGWYCDDEVNRILPGKNYGWSATYGTQCFGTDPLDEPDYVAPLLSFNPTVAPTGIVIYDGAAFPDWVGQMFFCEWNTGKMQRAVLNDDRTAIVSVSPLDLQGASCRIDIAIGPDGYLYFLDVAAIYRIKPA